MPAHRRSSFRLVSLAAALCSLVLVSAAPIRAAVPFSIQILSSAPNQVTGGDALVRVGFPEDVPAGMSLFLNGVNVTSSLHPVIGASGEGALVGVVSGFV